MNTRHKMIVLITLLVLVSGSSARGADTQGLEHVLDQWALAWSSNDPERLLPLFTDSVEYEDVTLGAVNRGANALHDFATGTFALFADLKFELKSRFVAADGKSGAMEWIMRGRQTKDFPNLPATNTPFEVRGATVVEFADGKISRNSDYWDLATYMKQAPAADGRPNAIRTARLVAVGRCGEEIPAPVALALGHAGQGLPGLGVDRTRLRLQSVAGRHLSVTSAPPCRF
jgi:steroid delta-isomerase-like uncharacterized protein